MTVPQGISTPPETAPAQGTNGQGQAQPQADGTGQSGFNWGLFPDVPEDQRPALEPHLKNVQAHVTRLEQQLAPIKPMLDSGLDASRLQGLAQFAQAFEADPLNTFLGMAAQLQEAGVIHDNLDLTELQAVAQGIDTDEGGQVPPPEAEGGDQMPAWAQQLMQRVEQMDNRYQQDQSQRQQRLQDALLQRQITSAKEQLQSAGVQLPEDSDQADRMVVAAIIANGGNAQEAVQSLTGFRETNLQAAVGQRQNQQQTEPTMPKGAPPAPKRDDGGKPARDGFEAARGGALQHLEQAAASAAEEG